MNKQQLAAKIWASANKMRSKIEANEYKDYILGFIFYKFLSEQEENKLLVNDGWSQEDLKNNLNEGNKNVLEYVQKNIGYFISYKDLFSTWLNMGQDFDVSNVKDALSSFNRLIDPSYKKVFNNIFNTLDTGISKLGDSSGAQTKSIRGLIDLIKEIPMDGKQDYDVLGFIYEYLISNFAANAGKKAGEFYTPHEVSLLMSEIVSYHLRDKQEIEIYDPTSGSGSLLINIGRSAAKHIGNPNNIKYYAQELKDPTYNLTRMNLVMRGILPSNIVTRCGDTLAEDWPYFDDNTNYKPLYVDAVVSNPPYSQKWEPKEHEADVRFAEFGLAPKSKADYAFLLHNLYHTKPNGIVTIVLPHGVLFRGGNEEMIRRNLIENNYIDTIIGLPPKIFYGTGIPTIIMVLKKDRTNSDVLFIDASKHFGEQNSNNILRSSDIKRILDAFITRATTPKFARLVSKEEIRKNEYNLNIPRYIDSSEDVIGVDLYATMYGGIPNSEIDSLNEYFLTYPTLRQQIYKAKKGTPYSLSIDSNVEKVIADNEDVKQFIIKYEQAFKDFENYLDERLIKKIDSVKTNNEENIISQELFSRLSSFPLIDKYEVYQKLDDSIKIVLQDIEVIQIEGIDCCKIVEPNMVIKKKEDKEVEVQKGFKGHILPFDIVQEVYFKKDLHELENINQELSRILTEYDDILASLSEEDKDSVCINEAGDAFVSTEVKKRVKELEKTKEEILEDSFEAQLIKVESLIKQEKELKKKSKEIIALLEENTKQTIQKLTIQDIQALLHRKWISPLVAKIMAVPNSIIRNLSSMIKKLEDKYADTMLDINSEIASSEKSLSVMLDDIVGDEFDMKAIAELKKMLKGDENE